MEKKKKKKKKLQQFEIFCMCALHVKKAAVIDYECLSAKDSR